MLSNVYRILQYFFLFISVCLIGNEIDIEAVIALTERAVESLIKMITFTGGLQSILGLGENIVFKGAPKERPQVS